MICKGVSGTFFSSYSCFQKDKMFHFKLFHYYFIDLAYKRPNAEKKDPKETVRKCLKKTQISVTLA